MKYETVEQAIEIANGTRYGLGASVFGPVKDDCLKVAKRLPCGMVAINDFGVFYVSDTTLDLDFGDRLTDVSFLHSSSAYRVCTSKSGLWADIETLM